MGLPIWRDSQSDATPSATTSDPTAHTRSSIRRRPRENIRDDRRPIFHGVLSGPREDHRAARLDSFSERQRRLSERGNRVRLFEHEMDRLAAINVARRRPAEAPTFSRATQGNPLFRAGDVHIDHEGNIHQFANDDIPTLVTPPSGTPPPASESRRTSTAISDHVLSLPPAEDSLLFLGMTPPLSIRALEMSDANSPSNENIPSRRPFSRHGPSWRHRDRLTAPHSSSRSNRDRRNIDGRRTSIPSTFGNQPPTPRPLPGRMDDIWRDAYARATIPPPAPAPAPAPEFSGLGDRERSWSPESDDHWETLFTTITPDPSLPSAGSSFASNAATANAPVTSAQVNSTATTSLGAEASAMPRIRSTSRQPNFNESLISPLPTPPHLSPDCDDDNTSTIRASSEYPEMGARESNLASTQQTMPTGRISPDSLYIHAVGLGLRTQQLVRGVSSLASRYHGFARAYNAGISPEIVRAALDEMSTMLHGIRHNEHIPATWWADAGIIREADGSLRRSTTSPGDVDGVGHTNNALQQSSEHMRGVDGALNRVNSARDD